MEVTKLVINGIEITTLDKPIGLEVNKLSLDRDFQYSCIDTTIEAELRFYCSSGKTELDAEFESKGVEGSGYIEITDSCGTNGKTYTFNLDFKKYNNQGDFTTIGLIDINSLWKRELNNEVNIDSYASGVPTNFNTPFYVRNLPLEYEYNSEKLSHEEISADYIYDYDILIGGGATDFFLSLYPRTNTTLNELEKGNELLSETLIISNNTAGQYIQLNNIAYYDSTGAVVTRPSFLYRVPDYEPIPIFENEVDDGEFTINVSGEIGVKMHFDKNYELEFNTGYFQEIVLVGSTWGSFSYNSLAPFNPLCGYIKDTFPTVASQVVTQNNAIPASALPYTFNFSAAGSHNITTNFPVKKGEKVWILNQFHLGIPASNLVFKTNAIRYDLNHEYSIDFKLTKNTTNVITTSDDVVPYHTLTSAYYGQTILNHIFGSSQNFGQTSCYSDLWFSKGDLMRNKINRADFIVKPTDFFRELEKVVCCGLGYFYDTNPSGTLKLLTVYDFYTDTLVPSQYQFDYNDLIDGKIELSPFTPPYYKDIQIGYSNFKDSPKDYCKLNEYSIDNVSESNYSKVSDFIASQYVITNALKLGTEDKDLEFDNNIFLFSGGQLGIYNATLSQPSGVLSDNIQTLPLNTACINRRYATALNLFRHLYKWGFSLFAGKTELLAKKYEGNTIYDYEIRDTTGTSNDPFYQGLSDCKLPLDNYVKVDRTISDIYTDFFQSGLHVPTQITFKTANLSSLDLIAMRAHQYDLFSVTDGTNIYYGNLISANQEDDITEIKLLRRFKNGI